MYLTLTLYGLTVSTSLLNKIERMLKESRLPRPSRTKKELELTALMKNGKKGFPVVLGPF